MEHEEQKQTGESVEALQLRAGAETNLDGKYILLEELGKGASGTVFKARHIMLDQIVAVKIIDPRLSSSENAAKRFHNEATVLSSFSDPNIVRFIAFGTLSDGRQYMVLEFLEGESLEKHLRRSGAMEQEQAVALFIDIAQALSYAHERGIVHRDLKPGNVILQEHEGQLKAKLVDFGIFKDTSGAASAALTQTGLLVGSANYMSPEQCKGAPADYRSDLYSVGCLMYETVVGQPPMQADSELLVMSNHLNMPTTSVPSLKTITLALEQIIIRCLKKNPEERYQSAKELIAALEKCDDAEPKRKRKNNNQLVVLSILPLVFFLATIGFFVIAKLRSSDKAEPVISKPVRSSNYPFDMRILPNSPDDLTAWLKYAVKRHSSNQMLADAIEKLAITRSMNLDDAPVPYADEVERVLLEGVEKERQRRNSPGFDKANLNRELEHLGSLALVQLINNKPEESKKTRQEIESLFKKMTDRTGFSFDSYRQMAGVEQYRGNYRNAIDILVCAEKYNSEFHLPCTHYFIAKSYLSLGEIDLALSRANKALSEYGSLLQKQSAAVNANEILQLGNMIYPIEPQKLSDFLEKHYKSDEQFELECNRDSRPFLEELRASSYLCQHRYAAAEKLLFRLLEYCRKNELGMTNSVFCSYRRALILQDRPIEETDKLVLDFLEKAKAKGDSEYLVALFQCNSTMANKEPIKKEIRRQIVESVPGLENKCPLEAATLYYQEFCCLLEQGKTAESLKYAAAAERLLLPLAIQGNPGALETILLVYQIRMKCDYLMNSKKGLEETFEKIKKFRGKIPGKDYSLEVSFAYYMEGFDKKRAIKLNEALYDRFRQHSIQYVNDYYTCAFHLANLYAASDMNKATALLTEALGHIERYRSSLFLERITLLNQLADLYKRMGKTREAQECLRKSHYLNECNKRLNSL